MFLLLIIQKLPKQMTPPVSLLMVFNLCEHGIEDTVAANFLPMEQKSEFQIYLETEFLLSGTE
jgi:hypothetical protein